MVAGVGGVFVALNAVPVPEINREIQATSFICLSDVADGECEASNARALISAGGSRRIYTPLDEMSPNIINAVIAAEDRSFFTHNGVDLWGITRAAYRSVAGSASRQGGSTITQQYVKMVYLSNEGTLKRKFDEAAIAMKIEREMSKKEILEAYLNEAPFGRGAIGVEAASISYFNKDSASLTIGEAAYLAGLLRAPSYADEPTNPEKPNENAEATRRRRTVLAGMLAMNYIDQSEYDEFNELSFDDYVLASAPSTTGIEVSGNFKGMGGEYIVEWVRSQLVDANAPTFVGEQKLFGGGIKVYLEIDPEMQYLAQVATQAQLDKVPGPSAAMMAVDEAGRIKAMIGGQNYAASTLNLALGRAGGGSGRQPGSTMKPVALAAYVAAGKSIKSEFWGPPLITVPDPASGVPLEFKNYDDADLQRGTIEKMTWQSANTVYIQLMQRIGPDAFGQMAAKLGIVAPQKREVGAVLGTSEASLLEMTVAYATLGNHGERIAPHIIRRIENGQGEVLYDVANDTRFTPEQAIDAGVADTVAGVLTGSIHSGTGANAKITKPAAGKTGTTSDNKDAWFAGFSCRLTAVFWMGYPNVDPATGSIPAMVDPAGKTVTGGGYPARMWQLFMEGATKNRSDCDIEKPDFGTTVDPIDETYAPTTTTIPPDPNLVVPGGEVVPGAEGGATTTVPAAPTTTAAPPPPE